MKKTKTALKLPLTDDEKANLRQRRIRMADIPDYAVDELSVILDVPYDRAREVHALAEFQTVPSIGIRFAEDLVFMGYYSLQELKGRDGATLTDEYEQKKGYWIDPCVEDQFRLVVHYTRTADATKTWWDFTEERKRYRLENGYPDSRPAAAWHEVLGIKRKSEKTA
ncbi:MAG: helix-hairpin-helix domain-containing protein [Cyclobacteriaceae bacterium]